MVKNLIQDILDSPIGWGVGFGIAFLAFAIGFSSITTSCANASVACIEAGGQWDTDNLICQEKGETG